MLQQNPAIKTYIFTTVILVSIVVIVALCTYYIYNRATQNEKNEANATLFNPGPAAAYVDMQGNPASLAAYQGSVVIVNTWASWSPYAIDELPLLEKIASDYADKKVVVLAINRKENREQADRFLNSISPVPHIKIIVDTTDYFYGTTGGYAMPETIIYNKEGTVIDHLRGTLVDASLRAQLDTLVDEDN